MSRLENGVMETMVPTNSGNASIGHQDSVSPPARRAGKLNETRIPTCNRSAPAPKLGLRLGDKATHLLRHSTKTKKHELQNPSILTLSLASWERRGPNSER